MTSGTFIKGITLFGFVFLITSFLLYRVGRFDNFINDDSSPIQTSPNGAVINSAKADTLKPQKDSLQKLRLSSSKSIVLIDKKPTYVDSVKNKYKQGEKKMTREILPGSKSAYIFRPRHSLADCIRKDSLLKQTQKPKQQ